MFPNQLLEFYQQNKDYSNPTAKNLAECWDNNDVAFYKIKFQGDFETMHEECKQIIDCYVDHRPVDKVGGYKHWGWKSVTLHGLSPEKTEHYTQYGFKSLEEATYKWTKVSELVPTLTSFLKQLPYSLFDRVRIMRLEAGGYIMPHVDGKGRMFGPLNIAINNPDNCHFVIKEKGIVPFEQGVGCILDVGREHIVINNSDQPRYHVIVHGYHKPEFRNM
jgi:hypothetical protein